MPRIVGVDVPNDKPLWVALTYIHGVGKHIADVIIKEAKVDREMRANKLTEDEVSRIAQIIQNNHVVEGQLRRRVAQNIGRLRDIRCYRGVRHQRGLPVRGQMTQSNARTRKGKKKTVAGKRSVKEMR
ncbi:30S ribosomal protein S13 [Anaerohalosphaera lusitana]|uniref:Small ribosomal subunit protein uS13 n=1 Tax=Anaerohalosphaera lusitana TaxID=1936003 RepID=A0A1U9NQE3_9BACT|nr:30S ribosomal protein S13 [Anaerohalosphaera lusitana]AQT69830.1 30S ribosomal protein S13 [Anaerohalosphaera lusitana]